MQTSALGKQRGPATVRTATSATLSVVVVSSGSAVAAQRAAQALSGASRDLYAQVIFVAKDEDPRFAAAVEGNGGEFVAAPAGSTRAEMCDLGMSRAIGSIVAVRDDTAVGNAQWLDAYRSVLPHREATASRPAPTEEVVMDTLVASRVALADTRMSHTAETRIRAASIEMAAAV
jgi:hypothetical protein